MAQLIKTRSDPFFIQAARVYSVLVTMTRSISDAQPAANRLSAAVSALETASVEVNESTEHERTAEAAYRTWSQQLREVVLGQVAYVELFQPALRARLPILSAFDREYIVVLLHELTRLVSEAPELAAVAASLRSAQSRELELEKAAEEARRRKVKARHELKGARIALEREIKEARYFIHTHAEPGSEYLQKLKRPYKPRKKKSEPTPSTETPPTA